MSCSLARSVLYGLLVMALSGLGLSCDSRGSDLADAVLSETDLPGEWRPVELADDGGQALWNMLPELLTLDSEAHLLLRAFEDASGTRGAATLLIEAEEQDALPKQITSERFLGPLSRLLGEQEALLGPPVAAGDPGSYFAASDVPTPGSLKSRLVRLHEDKRIFSDSVVYSTGPVLVVVTIWYPEEEGPARDVDVLAGLVEQRLQQLAH